ncbi:unnamed protein product [Didymodactylos carnosus]|uniref:Uncharacterized protein n=1 Tax=Didymodactylos carnosus TaxID=1234261 RepID=A0A814DNB8_9BILA|nr:unnamed protein product [Didymodactylos carnosus]
MLVTIPQPTLSNMETTATTTSSRSDKLVILDENGYISDSNNYRIQQQLPEAQEGRTIIGVILDENGYISDSNNYRIQQQLPEAQEGRTIIGGSFGQGSNQLSYAEAIKFDSDWNLIVADTANHRIQKFNLISNGCD